MHYISNALNYIKKMFVFLGISERDTSFPFFIIQLRLLDSRQTPEWLIRKYIIVTNYNLSIVICMIIKDNILLIKKVAIVGKNISSSKYCLTR